MLAVIKKIRVIVLFSMFVAGVFWVHSVFSHFKINKSRVVASLSQVVGEKIRVKDLRLKWHDFSPELVFEGVDIQSNGLIKSSETLHIRCVEMTIGLWASLFHWNWTPSSVHLSGANIDVTQKPTGDFVINHKVIIKRSSTGHFNAELLPGYNVDMSDIHLKWSGSRGQLFQTNMSLTYATTMSGDVKLHVITQALSQKHPHFDFQAQFKKDNKNDDSVLFAVHANDLDLAQFQAWLNVFDVVPPVSFTKGRATLGVNGLWYEGCLRRLNYQGDIDGGRLKWLHANKALELNHLGFIANFHRDYSGWKVHASSIHAVVNKQVLLPTDLVYYYHDPARKAPWFTFSINRFNLQHLPTLRQLLPSYGKLLGRLYSHHVKGVVLNLYLVADAAGSLAVLNAHFKKLAYSGLRNIFAVDGVSGSVGFKGKQGWATIDSRHVKIKFPGQADYVLFSHFNSQLYYMIDHSALRASVENLQISNKDLFVQGNLSFKKLGNKVPQLSANATYTLYDLARLHHYFPYAYMGKKLRAWLSKALLSGKLERGFLSFNGPVNNIAGQGGAGEFRAGGVLEKLNLHFAPKWPRIHDSSGNVLFSGKSMFVNLHDGDIDSNHLNRVRAVIPDLTHPMLSIKAYAHADLASAHRLLSQSPLTVGRRLQHVIMRGAYHLLLKLNINLHQSHSVKSEGDITMQRDKLQLPKWSIALQHLRGDLHFTDQSIRAKHITGSFLGDKVALDITTLSNPSGIPFYQITAAGISHVNNLLNHFHAPLQEFLHGSMGFHVVVDLPYKEGADPEIDVDSSLEGVSVDHVPSLLSKEGSEPQPVHIKIEPVDFSHKMLEFSYAKRFHAKLSLPIESNRLAALDFSLGSNSFKEGCRGICLHGNLPTFNVKRWKQFIVDLEAALENKGFGGVGSSFVKYKAALPVSVHVLVGKVDLFGREMKKLWVNLDLNKQRYVMKLNNVDTNGMIVIPRSVHQPWRILFSKLSLTPPANKNNLKVQLLPQVIPAMQVDCNNVHYGKSYYSKLKFSLASIPNGVDISNMVVESPLFSAFLYGRWLNSKSPSTFLYGRVVLNHAGNLFNSHKITHLVSGGFGSAGVSLVSASSPFNMSASTLTGNINFSFKYGRLMLPESSSFRMAMLRVLNVLSLSSLPEHLASAFTDVLRKGYQFDALKGNLLFSKGEISFDHLQMDGDALKMGVQGKVDLLAKTCDLTVSVYPYVTSSLPVVAGIAGGPLVGATAWVVNKLLEPSIGELASSTYHVSGLMNHPVVTKVG